MGLIMRTVYVNGEYVSEEDAKVSIFDRGFLFADGVYEVTSVLDGKLVDFPGHCARLRRSLGELAMGLPMSDEDLSAIHRRLVVENKLQEGLIYLQVTRGVAERDFLFPPEETPRTLVLFTQAKPLIQSALAARGQKVVTVEDLRWSRCDIKTVQLLYPSMAKMEAKSKGADDAWLVRDGAVTEGSSNNAYIVLEDGAIVPLASRKHWRPLKPSQPQLRDLSRRLSRSMVKRSAMECPAQRRNTCGRFTSPKCARRQSKRCNPRASNFGLRGDGMFILFCNEHIMESRFTSPVF